MRDIYQPIKDLLEYAKFTRIITEYEEVYSRNRILSLMREDNWEEPKDTIFNHLEDKQGAVDDGFVLEAVLKQLCDAAAQRTIIDGDSINERDNFTAELMDCIMPRPNEVIDVFRTFYRANPKEATDWYYEFSKNTDYIRRYRISKDLKWVRESEYGDMEITVNLSKPEKDPKAIAAAGKSSKKEYPACQLCADNTGYKGRLDHPGRANHRIIPVDICGEPWYLQYSPYVYYNEHCIVLSDNHRPMKIGAETFDRLLDFVEKFPHYFIGSNADLPIVGGSILSHDHFQGGRHVFPIEEADIEGVFEVDGFSGVKCAIVKWPMSVIRIVGYTPPAIVALANHILETWREYSDPEAGIFARTDDELHNTITPIARTRENLFEMDLVLRNNITSKEHPLGVFHPHEDLWHIKKENIGLIEVMGMAILPGRLKDEIRLLSECMVEGKDPGDIREIAKHADWAAAIKDKYDRIDESNINQILCDEIGDVFVRVLEDAGVFKKTPEGRKAFERFIAAL